MKPTLSEFARIDLEAAVRNAIRNILERGVAVNEFPYITCITCMHFDEGKEHCQLYNARPPARVIAFGCPSHDYIPY